MFLLNDTESTLHDKTMEKYTEKRKYEQSVSECNKRWNLIKKVVGINITIIYIKKIDTVWSEYGEIVNVSEITNGID